MKHKVTKVQIGFSELGRIANRSFDTMKQADDFFSLTQYQVGKEKEGGKLLGYYKTDFTITFDDGTEYKGRFDFGSDEWCLSAHVKRFCECYSGRVKPAHMKPDHWEHFKSNFVTQKAAQHFGNLLDNYDIFSYTAIV